MIPIRPQTLSSEGISPRWLPDVLGWDAPSEAFAGGCRRLVGLSLLFYQFGGLLWSILDPGQRRISLWNA